MFCEQSLPIVEIQIYWASTEIYMLVNKSSKVISIKSNAVHTR